MKHTGLFSLDGETAVITGGSGGLGRTMALGLASAGARVAVLNRHEATGAEVVAAIQEEGGAAIAVATDVLDRASLAQARERVEAAFGPIGILINAAGGNRPEATVAPGRSFFDLDPAAVSDVVSLNLNGTVNACQIFGQSMAARQQGAIVNIASMTALRPLTRVVAYSAAKAAVVNFTRWLAVHMAQEYSPAIRVNAIAPGFFLTAQNRYLMIDAATGELTARGQTVLAHTPAGRLGVPEDLIGTLLWLTSPAAAFVTGAVIPVDGGFSAFSGV